MLAWFGFISQRSFTPDQEGYITASRNWPGSSLIVLAVTSSSILAAWLAALSGNLSLKTSAILMFGFAGLHLLLMVSLSFAARLQVEGYWLTATVPFLISACISAAVLLPSDNYWGKLAGAIILFLGLLTLLNAPFDWFSLGITRALLRRGLELGGWWPFALAMVDALVAIFTVFVLSIVLVVGIQAFDNLAEYAGGPRPLSLPALFNGIESYPEAPELWWVYLLLASTMVPSIANLMIGGASLMRGVPGLNPLLLRYIPVGKAVPAFDRAWIALILTVQILGGAILGIVVQICVATILVAHVLPLVRLELLAICRAIESFDLPTRIGHFFFLAL
jgi:hypothetical protein